MHIYLLGLFLGVIIGDKLSCPEQYQFRRSSFSRLLEIILKVILKYSKIHISLLIITLIIVHENDYDVTDFPFISFVLAALLGPIIIIIRNELLHYIYRFERTVGMSISYCALKIILKYLVDALWIITIYYCYFLFL